MSVAKVTSLALLQIGHIGLFLAAALLCGLYFYLTDGHDYYRTRFDMIVIASGFVVPIATLLYCVIFGESADLRKRLVGAYRTLLLSKLFLLVANALLLAACGFLLYLMFSYRSITITLGERAQVYLNDAVGSLQFIGEWKRDQSRAVRMPVGDHYLVAKEPISGKVIASLPVKVRPPWQMCNCDRISLEIQQRPFHPLR